MKTISEIKEEVKRVGQRIFEANNFQFQRGFNTCFEFFDVALKKTTLYNQSILIEEMSAVTKVSTVGISAVTAEYTKQIQELEEKLHKRNIRINGLENEVKNQKETIKSLKIAVQYKYGKK